MRLFKISTAVLSIALLSFSSCKKEAAPTTTADFVKQGSWKVTSFNDNGTDETAHFTGFAFTFKNDGSVMAMYGATSVNGTWSAGNDDSQEKLNLDFNNTVPFDELNNDWHIIEKTETKIRLDDVSGGNGGTEQLTFEKN